MTTVRARLNVGLKVTLLLAAMLAAPVFAGSLHAQEAPAVEGGEAAAVEAASPGAPAGLSALLSELPGASYDRKMELARELAATGDERAGDVLKALGGGNLYSAEDGRIVITEDDDEGPFFDALTGEEIALAEPALSKVRVNNRLRGEIHGLTARLNLASPKPAIRRAAAKAAFTAQDAGSLDAVEEALANENDEGIKALLEQARAAILLGEGGASEADQLAAIETIRSRGDLDALNALLRLERSQSVAVRDAAAEAVADVKQTLAYWDALQNVYYGISLGSVLLLAAIGLAITFGVMGVINMAHGEMIMLGAYTAYVVQQVLVAVAPGLMGASLVLSIPAAFLVAGAAGIAIERTIIRFLYGRPLETLLATWGLSLILQQTVRTVFGPTNKPVIAPDWMSGAFELGQLTITYSRIWVIFFSLVVLALLMAFFKYTQFGTQMRAVTQNRKMAASMGVRTNWVDAFTFGLGSGVAGIAGVALSQIDNVSPNLGQSYIIDSFMVVVFGGVGNLWGTLVGALTLGVANKFLEPYAGAVMGKILVLVFIILFIQRRPRGLFALKGRSVES